MRPVFIGGCVRSGTTMLGDLLGAHPRHVCLPETSYKFALLRTWRWRQASRDGDRAVAWLEGQSKFRELGVDLGARSEVGALGFRDLFDRLAAAYARSVGRADATVWIDQTPQNVVLGSTLLEEWPEGRLVNLVRDGRAVAASVLPLDWGPNNATIAAQWWVRAVAHGLAMEASFPGRVLRVSYEDLVREPERILRGICEFADIEFDPAMVRGGGLRVPAATVVQHSLVGKPPSPSRLDAWRQSLSSREIELFEAEAGQLLPLLGYTPVHGETARASSPLASLVSDVSHRMRHLTINRFRKRGRRKRVT